MKKINEAAPERGAGMRRDCAGLEGRIGTIEKAAKNKRGEYESDLNRTGKITLNQRYRRNFKQSLCIFASPGSHFAE